MTSPINTIATNAAKAAPAELAKLKKVAGQFEAVFLRQMIGSMRSSSLGDGIFDSSATKQFQDMADGKTADVMAGKGVLHIADLLVKQLGARLNPTVEQAADASKTADSAAETAK